MTCSPRGLPDPTLSPVEERRKGSSAGAQLHPPPSPASSRQDVVVAWVSDPVTLSAQTSCLPCQKLNLGPPAAREGFQLVLALLHARQIQLDLNLLAEASQPCLHNTRGSVGLPRVRGPGAQPEPHSEPAPRLTFSPDVLQRTSVPQDHCPPGPARGSQPPACLALPSRPSHPLAQGIWFGLCIRKITAVGWRLD